MSAPASAAARPSATFVMPQILTRVLMFCLGGAAAPPYLLVRTRCCASHLFNAKSRWLRTFLLVAFTLIVPFCFETPYVVSYFVAMPRTVFFDYNATTPLDPAVRDAMLPFLGGDVGEVWGNPSSIHHIGRRARAMLDDARDRAAKFMGAKPSE